MLPDPDEGTIKESYGKINDYGERRFWAKLIFIFLCAALFCSLLAFLWSEELRHETAVLRIKLERDQTLGALELERIRLDKAVLPSTAPLSVSGPNTGANNVAGLELLKHLIAEGAASPREGSGNSSKRSTSAISAIIDGLVSAGQLTTGMAKSLKDDLQKAGLEIGVDAAKALIDRFIRIHEKPVSGSERSSLALQGVTQVSMYCNAALARPTPAPLPPSNPKPKPKKMCS